MINKNILLHNKKIIQHIILLMVLIAIAFLQGYLICCLVPKKNDQLQEISRLAKNDQLIGKTVDYCNETFGPSVDSNDYIINAPIEDGKIIYRAGYTYSSAIWFNDSTYYQLVIWYDENEIVTNYEIRSAPWI